MKKIRREGSSLLRRELSINHAILALEQVARWLVYIMKTPRSQSLLQRREKSRNADSDETSGKIWLRSFYHISDRI